MSKVDQTDTLLSLHCPLCQFDEYFISADGEKFSCASCGFHTEQFSLIRCLHHTPLLQTKFHYIHSLSNVCH
ncbi:hypothetical protein BS333_16890 [Vibrio azureus]|uniref:TFIIB-type domain-containing protein n=1 Tax=Vibrio azureus NBRC 104587 TaxID=1219077 RepID=U3AUJ2_9VIBR|nr:hypothetical protein [Vibrio azureus]AUI88050.1 hypothetical protein BS333_16890 [Vibrio azureus]GAD76912.1 hypothetical protein VAZ01S_055_00375 [Vibrio azureus NBRC 104587]